MSSLGVLQEDSSNIVELLQEAFNVRARGLGPSRTGRMAKDVVGRGGEIG